MKYQDKLKLKLILDDGFTSDLLQYLNDGDRLENARDDCIDFLLNHVPKKNLKLCPLVQLMLKYIAIKTDLKTMKIKAKKSKFKKTIDTDTDTDTDTDSVTVTFED